MNTRELWGKYRAIVSDNADPEKRGRLKLTIPDVLDDKVSTWAEACAPLTGPSNAAMGVYLVPSIGAGVWVEFEHGDIDYPIWTGCRWTSESDVPEAVGKGLASDPSIVLQSLLKHSIVISDSTPSETDGGIVIKSTSGATIVVNNSGIYINNGKGARISLKGPQVDINDGALSIQ